VLEERYQDPILSTLDVDLEHIHVLDVILIQKCLEGSADNGDRMVPKGCTACYGRTEQTAAAEIGGMQVKDLFARKIADADWESMNGGPFGAFVSGRFEIETKSLVSGRVGFEG
jgi:hypothetical protein